MDPWRVCPLSAFHFLPFLPQRRSRHTSAYSSSSSSSTWFLSSLKFCLSQWQPPSQFPQKLKIFFFFFLFCHRVSRSPPLGVIRYAQKDETQLEPGAYACLDKKSEKRKSE
jgi:hypothetical protein